MTTSLARSGSRYSSSSSSSSRSFSGSASLSSSVGSNLDLDALPSDLDDFLARTSSNGSRSNSRSASGSRSASRTSVHRSGSASRSVSGSRRSSSVASDLDLPRSTSLSSLSSPRTVGSVASSAETRARLMANQRRLDELSRSRTLIPFQHRAREPSVGASNSSSRQPLPPSTGPSSQPQSTVPSMPSTPANNAKSQQQPILMSDFSQQRLLRDFESLNFPSSASDLVIDQEPFTPSTSISQLSSPVSYSYPNILSPDAPEMDDEIPQGTGNNDDDDFPFSPPSMFRGHYAPRREGGKIDLDRYVGYVEYTPPSGGSRDELEEMGKELGGESPLSRSELETEEQDEDDGEEEEVDENQPPTDASPSYNRGSTSSLAIADLSLASLDNPDDEGSFDLEAELGDQLALSSPPDQEESETQPETEDHEDEEEEEQEIEEAEQEDDDDPQTQELLRRLGLVDAPAPREQVDGFQQQEEEVNPLFGRQGSRNLILQKLGAGNTVEEQVVPKIEVESPGKSKVEIKMEQEAGTGSPVKTSVQGSPVKSVPASPVKQPAQEPVSPTKIPIVSGSPIKPTEPPIAFETPGPKPVWTTPMQSPAQQQPSQLWTPSSSPLKVVDSTSRSRSESESQSESSEVQQQHLTIEDLMRMNDEVEEARPVPAPASLQERPSSPAKVASSPAKQASSKLPPPSPARQPPSLSSTTPTRPTLPKSPSRLPVSTPPPKPLPRPSTAPPATRRAALLEQVRNRLKSPENKPVKPLDKSRALARAEAVKEKKLKVVVSKSEKSKSPERKVGFSPRKEMEEKQVEVEVEEEETPVTLVEKSEERMERTGRSMGSKSAATLVGMEGIWPTEEERKEIVQAMRDLRQDNDSLVEKLADLDTEIGELQSSHAETERQLLASLNAAEDKLVSETERADLAVLEAERAKGEMDALRRENFDLVKRIEEMQRMRELAEAGLTHRESEVLELRANLEEERGVSGSLQGQVAELKALMARTRHEVVLPDPKDVRIAELTKEVAELRQAVAAASTTTTTTTTRPQSPAKVASMPSSPVRNGVAPLQGSPTSAARPRVKNSSPERTDPQQTIRDQAQQIGKLQAENEQLAKDAADAVSDLKREHDRVRKDLEEKVSQMEAILDKTIMDKESAAQAKAIGGLPPAMYPEMVPEGQLAAGSSVYHALQNRLTNLTRQMDAMRREHEREVRSLMSDKDRLSSAYEAKLLASQKDSLRTLEEQTRDLKDMVEALKVELGQVRGQLTVSELHRKAAEDKLEAAWKEANGSTEAVLRIAKEQGKVRERERGFQNEIRNLRKGLEEERARTDSWKRKANEMGNKVADVEDQLRRPGNGGTGIGGMTTSAPAMAMAMGGGAISWSEKLEKLSRRIGELEEKFAREDLGEHDMRTNRAFRPGASAPMRLNKGLGPEVRDIRSRWEDLSMELSILEDGGFSLASESFLGSEVDDEHVGR